MKRFVVALLSLVMAAIVLYGFRVGFEKIPGCPPDKACLRYMAWGNPEQLDVEREMIGRFNKQNPDVHVQLFTAPGSSYQQKAIMMLASRTAPDVLRIDHYIFPMLAKKKYFTDLTEIAKQDPDFKESDFFPTAMEECKIDGQLYGLNALYGGVTLYYNKTLFQKAGLEDPYELHKKGEWTWERFRQSAKAMTKFDGKRPLVFGTSLPAFPTSTTIVRAFGGDLMSPDMKTSAVDSPEAIQAFQFLADLIWKDKVCPSPSQGANSAFAFESGKLGMTFDWMGMSPRYRTIIKDFEWDVCPVPSGPESGNTIVKGNQLVIAKNSENPEAAWRFIRFLTGVEGETRLYAEIRRCFPTRIGVAYSPKYTTIEGSPSNIRSFTDSIATAKTLPINERWGEWTQILTSEIDNLTSGRERDAGKVLRRAKQRIDKALAEDPGF